MKKNTEVLSSKMALLILAVIVLVVFWQQIFSVMATVTALIGIMTGVSAIIAVIISALNSIFKGIKNAF